MATPGSVAFSPAFSLSRFLVDRISEGISSTRWLMARFIGTSSHRRRRVGFYTVAELADGRRRRRRRNRDFGRRFPFSQNRNVVVTGLLSARGGFPSKLPGAEGGISAGSVRFLIQLLKQND